MATTAHGVAPGLEATHFFQPPDIAYSSGALPRALKGALMAARTPPS